MLRPDCNVCAKGPEALKSALCEALATDAPSLIEAAVGMMLTPFEA